MCALEQSMYCEYKPCSNYTQNWVYVTFNTCMYRRCVCVLKLNVLRTVECVRCINRLARWMLAVKRTVYVNRNTYHLCIFIWQILHVCAYSILSSRLTTVYPQGDRTFATKHAFFSLTNTFAHFSLRGSEEKN